ncbi:hypothetical protein BJV78DRAFT_1352103 [Lactifluus subvellereus]|nr:hypothetical protein BJV78DRAFT_1352103 [Lactifluus subvellereus]
MLQSLNILSLPDELISVILENTDYSTLIACRGVRSCHRLKDIVDSSSALTYTIELGATGMCDGTPNGVGPAERLKRLRNSLTFWKNSVWSQPDHFPYSEQKDLAAVSGNLMVFLSTISVANGVTLVLLRFPSELRGIPEQQWYLHLEVTSLECISADDSQDLLIFSSLPNIHVWSLSTGGIHPLTNTPSFIHPSGIPRHGIFSMRIYDDLLACSTHESKPHILVLNWKTGEQMTKIPCFQDIAYFSFLDRTKIVFPHRIYDPKPVMLLRVVTLPDTPDDSPLRSYDFVLDIPTLGFHHREYLCVNTLPSDPSDSFPGLFHADPRNRLLTLEVVTVNPPRFIFQALHVTQATLLSYIATHPSDADTVSVPWEAWGQRNTRIVNLPDASRDRYSYHMPVITCGMHALIESFVFRDHKKLHIMDYHPGRIARILATHDAHLACTEGTVTGEGARHSDVTVVQRPNTGTSSDTDIRYVPKDIPLPDGLQSEVIRYILGEDVVVLLEFKSSWDNENSYKIARIFYHPI